MVTGQLVEMPTRGLPTHGLDNSWTGHFTDWSTRALDNSRTGQVAEWTTRGYQVGVSTSCPVTESVLSQRLSQHVLDRLHHWAVIRAMGGRPVMFTMANQNINSVVHLSM